jgi:RimJ/RimL family protein N-acetyltransferase
MRSEWKALWDGYNAFYGRHGATELPPEITQMTWAGLPRVYWQTQETNAVAMRLYDKVAERSGFVVYRKTS